MRIAGFFIDGSQYLPEKPVSRVSLTKLQLAIAVCGALAIVFLTSRVVPPPVSSDGVQPSPSPPPSASASHEPPLHQM